MANTAKLEGLNNLLKILDTGRISSVLAFNVAEEVDKLHLAIRDGVKARYTTRYDLTSVRVGNRNATAERGRGYIRNGLIYQHKLIPLARYPFTIDYANNVRNGSPTYVEVVRGKKTLVKGKTRRGGFVPNSRGTPVRITKNSDTGSFGFYERTSSRRYPIKKLYGLTLSQQANYIINHDASVRRRIDGIIFSISKGIFDA